MPITNLIQHPVNVDADGYEYSNLEIRFIPEEAHKVILCESFISTTCKSKDLRRQVDIHFYTNKHTYIRKRDVSKI